MKTFFKDWLPSITAAILVMSNIVFCVKWMSDIENRMEMVEEHSKNSDVHMPWEKKIDIFITRREAEKADDDLKIMLRNIETKVDYLYRTAQSTAKTN